MDALLADFRYGLRLLVKKPALAAVAILTLAVGIGANTAIFSVVNGIVLRPLPYPESHELVLVWQDHTRLDGPRTEWASPDNFFDWREQNEVFEGMFAIGTTGQTLSGVDTPEMLTGSVASSDVFPVLGLTPSLGRPFTAEEDRASGEPVVLLSHELWQRRFGGNADVLGESLSFDGVPTRVIGVLPAGTRLPVVGEFDFLMPLGIDRTNSCGRSCVTLRVVARLRDGVSLERARAEMDAVAARLERDFPNDNEGVGAYVELLHDNVVGPVRAGLYLLLGAVGLVLLIACANVASLMLARSADRQREVATRVAMGASRTRLLRQMLTESIVLAGIGSALGLVLALWGVSFLQSIVPDGVPRFSEVRVDGRALTFTLVTAVVTAVVFGLVPAFRASRPNLQVALREGARGSGVGSPKFRSAIVVGEVALALALVVGAGLLIRSFTALVRVDPGFDAENVLTARLSLAGERFDERHVRVGLVDRVRARIAEIPGVESSGAIFVLPMGGINADAGFRIEGREPLPGERSPVAWYRPATPDYFVTMRTKLVAGRLIEESDDAEATPVALVNETAAKRYWAGADPLGSRIYIGGAWRRVVGVVGDTRHFGLDTEERPALYFPFAQLPTRIVSVVMRTRESPESLAGALQSAVSEVDPTLAVAGVSTMRDVVAGTVARPRVVTMLLGIFAFVAVALAAIGLYGVISDSVRSRTHEIGVRMALGARARDVVGWTLLRGLVLLGMGALVGLPGAYVLSRFMESQLYAVSRTDPLTYVVAPLLFATVSAVALVLPARRAARTDPVVALRYE